MAEKTDPKKPTRLSKGERTHNRRVKQATRKEASTVQPKK